MDISTQHVWDYAGDGYVHRLIQSKPNFSSTSTSTAHAGAGAGKEKRVSAGSDEWGLGVRHENEAFRTEGEDMVPREKMETMANEYTYLLTSQLEGQRRYFEEQVERAVDKASEAGAKAEAAASHAEKATGELEAMQTRFATLTTSIGGLEKSLEKSERAKEKFEKMARDMSSQLREEKTLNAGLMERIKAADAKAEEAKQAAEAAKAEKAELEEISGQEKVKQLQEQGEEVVEGSVSLPEQEQKKKGKGRKR
jgi:BRCA1-associated protein